MATTKKKSQTAKSKTAKTKKSSSRAMTRSAAARSKSTTKRVTMSKPAAVKVSTTTTKDNVFKKLNGWNWILALAYALVGVALIVYSETVTRSITTTYLTEDTLSGANDTVFVQATRALFDLNIAYFLAAVVFVAALKHVLAATVLRKQYEADLHVSTNRARWLGHGIGDGLAIAGVGLIVGISDLATLFAISTFVFLSTVAVISAHNHIGSSHKTSRLAYWSGALLVLAPWIIIGYALLSSNRLGAETVPTDYMYYLAGSVFVLNMIYMYVERMRHKDKKFTSDYGNVEWSYMIIGFALKMTLVGIVFNYLLK